MIYDLKCPVSISSAPLADFISKQSTNDLLLFGENDHGLCGLVKSGAWFKPTDFLPEGIWKDSVKKVRAAVGPDPRFVRTLGGYWVRTVTVREIFDQFGGGWSVIAAIHTGKDRMIWWSEQVQAALPSVFIVGEDGHNEDLIERAWDMGYESTITDDCLVMVRK